MLPALVPTLFASDLNLYQNDFRIELSTDNITGPLAGRTNVSEFAAAIDATSPGTGGIVEQILGQSADLSPSAADAQVCDEISTVHTIRGVTATLQ